MKLDGKLDYDDWCEGIREGRNYVSDGRSHLMEFKVNDVAMGENGSELKLAQPGHGARHRQGRRLAEREAESRDRSNAPYSEKPYWDIERARIGDTAKCR